MKHLRPLIIALFILPMIFGCKEKINYIHMATPLVDQHPELSDYLLGQNLPEGFEFTADLEMADFVLSYHELLTSPVEFMRYRGDQVLVKRVPHVPALPFWSPVRDVTLDSISQKLPQGPILSPKKEDETKSATLMSYLDLSLPWKAVTVEEMYPDNREYPFIQYGYITQRPQSLKPAKKLSKGEILRGEKFLNWYIDSTESWLTNNPLPHELPPVTYLGGVGDIMPGRGVDSLLRSENGVNKVFKDVLPILQKQDYLMGNLETAITYSKESWPKAYNFKVSPTVLGPLKEAGFDYFSLTNNHIFDYQIPGFKDTLTNLEKYGIATSGAGMNLEEARKPTEIVVNERVSLRVLSLGAYPNEGSKFRGARDAAATEDNPGVLWNSPENRAYLKEILADEEHFSVLIIHGGYEWANVPNKEVMDLYHSFADYGADLILAHHPHVLQGMEWYNDCLIAYSLANFIFPGMELTEFGEETLVLSAGIVDNQIKYLDFYPVEIDLKTISLEHEKIGDRFIELTMELYEEK